MRAARRAVAKSRAPSPSRSPRRPRRRRARVESPGVREPPRNARIRASRIPCAARGTRVNARVDRCIPRRSADAAPRVFHPRRAPFAESAESSERPRGRAAARARPNVAARAGDAGETGGDGGGDASSRGARRGRTRARRRDARRVESDGTRDDDGRVVGMEAMARAGVERRGDGGARERTREGGN